MISVLVDENTLEINKRGSITGEIFIRFEDSYFPEPRWNDFVVVILIWWNKSTNLLETSSVGTSVEFNFMDGPFYVRGVKRDNENVSLSFIRRTKVGEEILSSLDTDMDSLKKTIIKASKKILKVLQSKNWLTEDIEQLKKLL
ncbi:hypothetical protein [Paenibacillus sp. sgz500992]|uniref:hypothetical protein n=1 Tax=Paenibacillus sp. sgz500992 TaxID=3242476 RepID=UPI0036D3217D